MGADDCSDDDSDDDSKTDADGDYIVTPENENRRSH